MCCLYKINLYLYNVKQITKQKTKNMKTLDQLQKMKILKNPLNANEILNLAPENHDEQIILIELVKLLKEEIKIKLFSDISHRLND